MKSADFFEQRILSDNEGKEALKKLFLIILSVALIIIPSAMAVRYFDDYSLSGTDIVLFSIFITFSLSYFLLKSDKLSEASILFIVSAWVGMTFLAWRSAGIKDVSIIGYILVIYLTTLLNGYRFATVMTVMSVASIWILAFLQHTGIFIPYHDPPIQYTRDFTIFVILVITAVILFERTLQYSYQRIRKELHERTCAEEKLSMNEKKLLEQNEELLAAKIKAEESDRMKTAFLQNISHEIRTPMNGIVGLSELMRSREITSSERVWYINKMLVCSEQLAALIDDLISVSKLEAGAVEISKSEFRAEELLHDIHRHFKGKAAEKGIMLETTVEIEGIIIKTDKLKLNQIIRSLADNAIKFTNSGTVRIHAAIKEDILSISVSDTGIGIAKEDIPFIFDHFRQSETGLARTFSGAGLGLSICRGNLKYLGGVIKVESEPGKGSVFTVSVPVALSEKNK